MKISKIKHVVVTSIVFLCIIACIVAVYNSCIEMLMKEKNGDYVYRVVATKDIEIGELITFNNVERVELPDVKKITNLGRIYKLQESDNHVESVQETLYNLEKAKEIGETINMRKDDGLWAIGKVAKEKIYEGEILIAQRIGLEDIDN